MGASGLHNSPLREEGVVFALPEETGEESGPLLLRLIEIAHEPDSDEIFFRCLKVIVRQQICQFHRRGPSLVAHIDYDVIRDLFDWSSSNWSSRSNTPLRFLLGLASIGRRMLALDTLLGGLAWAPATVPCKVTVTAPATSIRAVAPLLWKVLLTVAFERALRTLDLIA